MIRIAPRRALTPALLTVAAALVTTSLAAAAVPLRMPLQGVLRDNAGAPVMDGAFDVTFTLYADAEGALSVWTESWPPGGGDCVADSAGCVEVAAGVFRVDLGTHEALDAELFSTHAQLWLGMTVETDAELPLRPLGTTPFAFHAGSAADLACSGCVGPEALSPEATTWIEEQAVAAAGAAGFASDAAGLAYDDTDTEVGAGDVQGAIEALKALIDEVETTGGGGTGSPGDVHEGAGTIAYARDNTWTLGPFGSATEYLHLFDPAEAKVVMYLYGEATSSFAAGNNLAVAYDFEPNQYSAGVQGNAGEVVLQVADPGIFNPGDHILVYQTIGLNGTGTHAGQWETAIVEGVEGGTVFLVNPLDHDYGGAGGSGGQAQAVVAASYNNMEVLSSGTIRPSAYLDGAGERGGVVYVRAQTLTVRAGGHIHADGYGFDKQPGSGYQGDSECNAATSQTNSPNCSGGGGTGNSWCGGGGGGNKTPGQPANAGSNCGSAGGQGGLAKGDDTVDALHMGGARGSSWNWPGSTHTGAGGGLVVLGAAVLKIEPGGVISAQGADAGPHISGGGAGGTVALFADQIDHQGSITADGGSGYANSGVGSAYSNGGDGGDGWIHMNPAQPGMIPENHPKHVSIRIDGLDVTSTLGDPNGKGSPAWDPETHTWGADGLTSWSTGPLDLTHAANWTLGEHVIELQEHGGAGGALKAYIYVLYPFTGSSPPANDTCDTPQALDPTASPVVVSGTTEDIMGKTLATDSSQAPGCGGTGGPDVAYQIEIAERSLLHAAAVSAFPARLYVRSGTCDDGELVWCAGKELTTDPLEPGTYFLFVDSDAAVAKGDFTLAVSTTPAPLPDHDTCDDALELIFSPQGIATHSGTTLYALDQYQGWCDLQGGGPDVIYQFTAATGESIHIEVETDEFSPILYVYKGGCGTTDPVYCTASGTLTTPAQNGGEYYLVVDGAGTQVWGAYNLTVELQ